MANFCRQKGRNKLVSIAVSLLSSLSPLQTIKTNPGRSVWAEILTCCASLLLHLQAIGVRLNELCHAESESPANLLGLIYDEETKRRLRKEDEEEDFLDDSKETPFTTRNPACKNLCFRST